MPQYITVTPAARTVLDDATVAAMVDTLGGAAATGSGGLVRASGPTISSPTITWGSWVHETRGTGTGTSNLYVSDLFSLGIVPVYSYSESTGVLTIGGGGATYPNATLIGTPTAPTAAPGTDTTQVATTAFARALVAGPTMEIASGVAKARGPLTAVNWSGSVTLDLATSNRYTVTLTGTVTDITVSGGADGDNFILFVRGQASGYTLAWWSGIKWTGGAAPTIPTTSGRVMAIAFTRLGSGEYWGTAAPEAY